MKLKLVIIIFVFGLVFVACKQEKKEVKTEEKQVLQNFMIGAWETQYIKIEMPTVNKTDSTSIFEDDFSKPTSGRAQSMYNVDGTFSAWFKQPDSSKVGETKGKWKTKGDSLYVDYFYLGNQVQVWYLIKQTNTGFTGNTVYDWDNDGEFDDSLLMKSKRIK